MKKKIVRIMEYIRSYGLCALVFAIVRRILSALQKKLRALETRVVAFLKRTKKKSAA